MGSNLQKKTQKISKMADENWAEAAPQEENQDWGEQAEELAVEESENEPKMFGKWDLSEVKCMDMALADYIKFDKGNAKYLAHNSSRFNKTRFKKAQCHIVARLVNALMQKGRNNGKKMLSMRIVKHAFRIIKTIAECLADELMNAAKGSSNSFAIKKKDE